MEENIEFREIGKRTPYQAPDGFFDAISEKTLQNAKQKESHHRKNLFVWRTMAVAASLAALLTMGYFISRPDVQPESRFMAQGESADSPRVIPQMKEAAEQPEVAEVNESVPEITPEPATEAETNNELLGDVLADLSDEELMQLMAMYHADPFIGEPEQ